jgi:hypothetical protein
MSGREGTGMVRCLSDVRGLLKRRSRHIRLYLLEGVTVMHGTASCYLVKLPLQRVALLPSGHEHVIPHPGGLYSRD